MSSPAYNVTITRVINCTANELYDACTDPTIVQRWLGATSLEADVRVKGAYRVEVEETDGKLRTFAGQYKVLAVGHRIVQTFADTAAPVGLFSDEELEIQLAPQGSLTKLTLIHSWNGADLPPTERKAREARWSASLERLSLAVELPGTLDS
ncbi:MAG: SRPBCC family protein [Kofleriaceae bacterium]|nr:SRPBCC family protein [Kofleriaceae bacterium]